MGCGARAGSAASGGDDSDEAEAAGEDEAGHRVSGRVRRAPAVHHAEFRAGY